MADHDEIADVFAFVNLQSASSMASHRNAGELIQKVFWLFGLTFDQKGRGLQVDMLRTD
jgi:hypothetical protein